MARSPEIHTPVVFVECVQGNLEHPSQHFLSLYQITTVYLQLSSNQSSYKYTVLYVQHRKKEGFKVVVFLFCF